VLVPISDLRITNLLVVMLFTLFDMLVCFILIFFLITYIVSVYSRVSVVCRLGEKAKNSAATKQNAKNSVAMHIWQGGLGFVETILQNEKRRGGRA
tara:strand:- start:340 stop:627 length:288 start_codon:yes stop_codon:yes gene_type:complete